MIVFAHAGHWLVQAAYLAPLVILVGILVVNQLKERRARARPAGTATPDAGGAEDAREAPGHPPE